MEKGSCGNREPAKKRQKECSRSEEANRERLLLGFNVFHKEVREVKSQTAVYNLYVIHRL